MALPLTPQTAVTLTQTLLRTVHVPSFAASERLAALKLLLALLEVGWVELVTDGRRAVANWVADICSTMAQCINECISEFV